MNSFQTIRNNLKQQIDRCELCGGRIGLDVHHIIPKVCGGPDTEDNLIVICAGCHGKLTPRSTLTKYGQHKMDKARLIFNDIYEAVEEKVDDYLSASDVLEIIIEVARRVLEV